MAFEWLKGFQDGLEERGIGGNDCAVYVDGEQVYRHFSGYQNREDEIPISEDTLYRMFSMTKPITCAAAMQLFEQGKFLLNDPVADYLPEFAEMKVKTPLPDGSFELRPARNILRIQHLFEMTSGIDYDLNGEPLQQLSEETGGRYTTRQVAALQAARPLRFEPGAHWFYGLSHDVIGALIEVISGKTFGEYLEENLFGPLGMTAWFHEPEEERGRLCRRYGLDPETGALTRGPDDNFAQSSPLFESGGGGLVMTVDDYAKFACAMTNRGVSREGTRILCGRTVDLMRTNRLGPTQLSDLWMTPARDGYGYGLGVRTLYDPARSGSTTARGEFGWGGAWGTYVLMDPENQVTLVYGEQGVNPQNAYIQRRLRNIAYAELEREGLI